MDRTREVLVGKLAIGRGLLSREVAVRFFHEARNEPFWELAVRAGVLPRAQAEALVARVETGELVCRGTCGLRVPLASASPEKLERCARCGGPVYVASPAGRPAARPTPAPVGAASPAAPAPAAGNGRGALEAGFSPQAPTLAPQRLDPGAEVPDSSLPSAIPIPKPDATPPDGSTFDPEHDTKVVPPSSEPGFAPFALGSYDVLAPIGRGGMGTVFRGVHRALKKMVAIKVLLAGTQDQRVRFEREIQATAKLDHASIVKVLSGGVVTEGGPLQGRPYFAMEYVAGRDLATWAREKPRSLREIIDMMVKICEAIHYAHNRQIIHRDLKPQNVLVAHESDVPKVCDFGLAKVAESELTRTGDIMGTPQYMPPEQILGDRKKIGPPTDVYGLGAVLYHVLTGSPPFNAAKVFKLTEMVVRDKPVPPSQKNPAIPPALDAIVLKALEKEPVKRFITARDLGRALAAVELPQ